MTDDSRKKKSDIEQKEAPSGERKNRRDALATVVATAGIAHSMSGNWSKPLLSSVVLPAHARPSLPCCEGQDGTDGPLECVPCDGDILASCDGPCDG